MFALYTSDNITYIMDSRERFFVNNYSLYGESSAKRCGYTKKEVQAIKTKYKKQGVYMLPVRKMAENKMPAKKGSKKTSDYSSIAFAISCLDYDDQNTLIEFSKNVPSPSALINDAITLQLTRLGKAMRAEQEQGILLDSTSDVMRDYVMMIQAKKTIDDGQDINLNVKDSISSWLDELERIDDDDVIEYDYDKEQRKDKMKELRQEEFSDLLNELE